MQAHYIKVKWTDNPIVYGKLKGDEHTYFKYLHATPYHSDNPVFTYNPTQLSLFDFDHPLHNDVDDAMAWIGDHTLQVGGNVTFSSDFRPISLCLIFLSRSYFPYHMQIISDCFFPFSYPLSPQSLIPPCTI